MKTLRSSQAVLLFILVFQVQIFSQDTFHGCPMAGNATRQDAKDLNLFKNRYTIPSNSDYDNTVTLAKLLQPGDDVDRFSNDKAVTIEGYVYNVKAGGRETCNCGTNVERYKDIHIEIVPTKGTTTYKKRVIVEITPRLRDMIYTQLGITGTWSAIKSLIKGKHIKIKGWLMLDTEHLTEAENTDPGDNFGNKNFRATCWEVHPVTSIEVIN